MSGNQIQPDAKSSSSSSRRRGIQTARLLGLLAVPALALAGCTNGAAPAKVNSSAATVQNVAQSDVVLDPALERSPDPVQAPVLEQIAAAPTVAEHLTDLPKVRAAKTCKDLTPLVAAGYTTLLKDLGTAKRTDTKAIDAAMDKQGVLTDLIKARAEALTCDLGEQKVALCAATTSLTAGGEVGKDVLDRLREACA